MDSVWHSANRTSRRPRIPKYPNLRILLSLFSFLFSYIWICGTGVRCNMGCKDPCSHTFSFFSPRLLCQVSAFSPKHYTTTALYTFSRLPSCVCVCKKKEWKKKKSRMNVMVPFSLLSLPLSLQNGVGGSRHFKLKLFFCLRVLLTSHSVLASDYNSTHTEFQWDVPNSLPSRRWDGMSFEFLSCLQRGRKQWNGVEVLKKKIVEDL